jgi:CMP-2-keto-3-deoxyoctulosonic acid synthetase
MVYILDNTFIEVPYHISIYPYNKGVLREILENIYPGPWEVHERPPGLAVLRALTEEDKTSGIYLIDIWVQSYSVAIVSC